MKWKRSVSKKFHQLLMVELNLMLNTKGMILSQWLQMTGIGALLNHVTGKGFARAEDLLCRSVVAHGMSRSFLFFKEDPQSN